VNLQIDPQAWTFRDTDDERVSAAFRDHGYVIVPAEDRSALDAIRHLVVESTCAHLGCVLPDDEGAFLETIGARIDGERLNDLRLAVIDRCANTPWFRPAYYALARNALQRAVGNDLAMQRSLGFSIQLPNDPSSVLPLHSDVWSEDSPYEFVLWTPLVDCRRTMAMFLLEPPADERWRERMADFAAADVEALYRAVEPELRWIEIDYGSVLLFSHTLMHGNRMNVEANARWSFNVRFKGLFTPYADKQLGDFFEPIAVRPATEIGLGYRLPGGFA
jgi:sporadic carbohydrate cluster 2OG-Fe(II) oxygenase